MPLSRRQILRSSALSLTVLGGCLTSSESPADNRQSTRVATQRTSTSDPTETLDTRRTQSSLRCGHGPLPENGWPLPEGSTGQANYAPAANGPTTKPTAEWTVTATVSEPGAVHFTRPIVVDGYIYVGRAVFPGASQLPPDTQYIRAYDAETGDKLWQAPVSGTPNTPAITENTVLIHDDRTVYALNTANGKEKWTFKPKPLGYVKSTLPTADGTLVAVNRSDTAFTGEVLALDLDGQVKWRVSVPSSVNSDLAWVGGMAYVVTRDAVLVAIDTDEEAVTWTRNLQDGDDTAPARLAVTPCAAFVTVDGVLYAVKRDGTLAWSVKTGGRELATDGDTIYSTDGSGYVRAFAVSTGQQRWEQFYGIENSRKADGFDWDPAVDADTIYAGTIDGKLLGISTSDGNKRWTIERDGVHPIEVVVVDDTLYTAWGSHLIAFR